MIATFLESGCMMEFFRKYQRFFLIAITAVVIASFLFFGAFSTYTDQSAEMEDRLVTHAIDGSKLMRSQVQKLSRFLATDQQDISYRHGPLPNFCNDGVIRQDLLQTGLAEVLVSGYFDSMREGLQDLLEKVKHYHPYVHPEAPFLSAVVVWDRFVPGLHQAISTLQQEVEITPQVFTQLTHLYQFQTRCPPEWLRRILLIHLAAYYSFKEEHSDKYEMITVKGTERLLKALQHFEVEQFLFTSTMLVHAPTRPGIPIHEDSPVAPSWDYPRSKVKTEKLIHELRGNIPTVILRVAGVYDDRCHSIPISHQIQRIYENKLEGHFFPGDISHGASFVHMDDLVDAIELAVEGRRNLAPELTLLIGEPKTLSYEEMQCIIACALGKKGFTTLRIPKPLAKIGAWIQCHLPFGPEPFIQPWMIDLADDHYELDISRAHTLLGWKPNHSLNQSLITMVEALKTDSAKWYKDNGLSKN